MSCSLFFNTLTLCGFYEFMSLLSLARLLLFSPARIWKTTVMLVFPFHFPACGMWLAFHVKQRVRGTERTELTTFRQGCVIFLTTWCVPDWDCFLDVFVHCKWSAVIDSTVLGFCVCLCYSNDAKRAHVGKADVAMSCFLTERGLARSRHLKRNALAFI